MQQIQQITDDSLQTQNLILPDGTVFTITLYFAPMQYGWFVRDLTYQTFEITNVRIVNSPNFLQQYRNIIPFGLACFSKNEREPSQQQDFSSGASKIYVLTAAEVDQFNEFLTMRGAS